MHRWLALCGGFLLAVLWMDLMFDVQVRGHAEGPLPEPVLDSIATYYARVTTGANPMGRLVGAVMTGLLVGLVVQNRRAAGPRWLRFAAIGLAVVPIGLAGARILPNAIELGTRAGSPEAQSALARSIYSEHVACFILIALFVACQLGMRAPDPSTPRAAT